MFTHFSTSPQQFQNRVVDNTLDLPASVVEGSSVLFICETSAITGQASSTFAIEFQDTTGVVVHRLSSAVAGIGRAEIGATIRASWRRVYIRMDVTGRMTMAFRVVSFAPEESVPETY